MNKVPNFNRKNHKDAKKNDRHVSENYDEILQALGRANFGCICMVDLVKEKLQFISGNPFLFCGLESSEVEKLGYDFYFKYVKPEDLEVLKVLSESGFKFFEELPISERKLYTITYDFHLTDNIKADVLINHRITPLELSEDGKVTKVICRISYSLNKEAGNMSVSSNSSKTFWRYNYITGEWSEEDKISLKVREIEIIRLYLQGLKIDEIAKKLYVSPNTIKFHRSKLFEKIGVNNILEAISYVISHNLISVALSTHFII